jgi:hypothetical protein
VLARSWDVLAGTIGGLFPGRNAINVEASITSKRTMQTSSEQRNKEWTKPEEPNEKQVPTHICSDDVPQALSKVDH